MEQFGREEFLPRLALAQETSCDIAGWLAIGVGADRTVAGITIGAIPEFDRDRGQPGREILHQSDDGLVRQFDPQFSVRPQA